MTTDWHEFKVLNILHSKNYLHMLFPLNITTGRNIFIKHHLLRFNWKLFSTEQNCRVKRQRNTSSCNIKVWGSSKYNHWIRPVTAPGGCSARAHFSGGGARRAKALAPGCTSCGRIRCGLLGVVLPPGAGNAAPLRRPSVPENPGSPARFLLPRGSAPPRSTNRPGLQG